MQESDYDDEEVDQDGHTELWHAVDALWTTIRGNVYELDYEQYWDHLEGSGHNLQHANGQASTFGGMTQDDIETYIVHVISDFRPRLSNTHLVFDSTGGLAGWGFTSGQSSYGTSVTNIRVTCSVAEIVHGDAGFTTAQLTDIVVTNAYPIA